MASESERDDFQQILQQIGGKSNIYLISAVSETDVDTVLLRDFIADMFTENMHKETGNSNGENKIQTTLSRGETDPVSRDQSQSEPSDQNSSIAANRCTKSDKPEALKNKTVTSSGNIKGKQRTITCAVIIFIFGHDYVRNKDNNVCLREILKDVRARIKRNEQHPALLGLIYTDCSQSQTRESVDFLDRSLRSVFINHPQNAIWTGRYVTKAPDVLQEIKRNTCKVVRSSMCADSSTGSKGSLFWPLTCLPGIFKKGNRRQDDITSRLQQASKPHTDEEGIPLQMRTTAGR